jgi:hypothetical protein
MRSNALPAVFTTRPRAAALFFDILPLIAFLFLFFRLLFRG